MEASYLREREREGEQRERKKENERDLSIDLDRLVRRPLKKIRINNVTSAYASRSRKSNLDVNWSKAPVLDANLLKKLACEQQTFPLKKFVVGSCCVFAWHSCARQI